MVQVTLYLIKKFITKIISMILQKISLYLNCDKGTNVRVTMIQCIVAGLTDIATFATDAKSA